MFAVMSGQGVAAQQACGLQPPWVRSADTRGKPCRAGETRAAAPRVRFIQSSQRAFPRHTPVLEGANDPIKTIGRMAYGLPGLGVSLLTIKAAFSGKAR